MKTPEGKKLLKIGELARLTSVSSRTIRFYVEEGLLPEPLKTQRNMAFYHPDCIAKIKAIKKAQSEKFLPLTVIARMLKENDNDFSVFDSLSTPAPALRRTQKSTATDSVPGTLMANLARKRWISSQDPQKQSSGDKFLLNFFQQCFSMGLDGKSLLAGFERIEGLIEKAVETEFQTFFACLGEVSGDVFEQLLETEKHVVQGFMGSVREHCLANILTRHHRAVDNALLAAGDEGYGIPLEVVAEDLEVMQSRVNRRQVDIQLLIDLATGYSCAGDQQKAMALLKRAIRKAPDNIGANVRWCWYHRFTHANTNVMLWRDRLARLVEDNPGDIPGHIFLSAWYAFDSTESSDTFEGLRLINLCLKELRSAEQIPSDNLHDWVLSSYARGFIYTYVLARLGEREKGISAFEAVILRRQKIDLYYADRMPYFPKWLWPNLLYFHGLACFETGGFAKAEDSFENALQYTVSPILRNRIEAGLSAAQEALSPGRHEKKI